MELHSGVGNGTPLQYSCLENPMDRGAWWAAVHGVAKSRTRLSDFTFIFRFHTLGKEMATHSSVLAWRIPGMEEPGRRPSMGSHRVGHDWSDLAAAAAAAGVSHVHLQSVEPSKMWRDLMSFQEREKTGDREGGVRWRGRQKPEHAKSDNYSKNSELHLIGDQWHVEQSSDMDILVLQSAFLAAE